MGTESNITITHADAAALANRLAKRGTEKTLAEQIAVLETESRLAGRLIRAMLRQTHSSDFWQLPPEA
jgi:hypothetical protein